MTYLFWEKLFLLIHVHINSAIEIHSDEDNRFISASTKYELIGERCNSLRETSLASFVGNHWVTDGLQVNSSSVKGGLISFAMFLLEENAIWQ